jgi:hypothetical protein
MWRRTEAGAKPVSRRSRSRGNPVSLFAFQDIITSVTAIMILLVLILTLEFVTRARQAGVAQDHRAVAADLGRAVRHGETRLAELERELEEATRQAKRATSLSRDAVAARLDAARQRQADLEGALARAENASTRARSERRGAEGLLLDAARDAQQADRLEARAAADTAAAAALEKENKDEADRQRETKAASAKSSATRLVFNPSNDDGKEAILVEVAGDGVNVLPAGGGDRESLGPGGTGPSARFRRWLRGVRGEREYVVIMLRPSGIGQYAAIRDTIIDAGVDVGTELVPEELAISPGGMGAEQ